MITHRLADLQAERSARRSFARGIFDRLLREEFYATNTRDLERTIRDAQREEFVYEHLIGEPMPGHLRSALMTEVEAWSSLYETLVHGTVTESEYAIECARLRPRVLSLMDLLDMEMEMLSNPLVRYYERWLRTYRESSR